MGESRVGVRWWLFFTACAIFLFLVFPTVFHSLSHSSFSKLVRVFIYCAASLFLSSTSTGSRAPTPLFTSFSFILHKRWRTIRSYAVFQVTFITLRYPPFNSEFNVMSPTLIIFTIFSTSSSEICTTISRICPCQFIWSVLVTWWATTFSSIPSSMTASSQTTSLFGYIFSTLILEAHLQR